MKQFKNIQIVFLLIYVLVSLSSCSKKQYQKIPIAENGTLDIRNWDFDKNGNIKLNGQWEFYWMKLLKPIYFKVNKSIEPTYTKVPEVWNKIKNDSIKNTLDGYATYRLTVLLERTQVLNLYTELAIYSSSQIYVNGTSIGTSGTVADNFEDNKSSYNMLIEPFELKKGENEIVILVSNFEENRIGGILFAFELGKIHNIAKLEKKNFMINLLIIGGIFIFMIYHFALFVMRPNNKSNLYFALFNLSLLLYFISQYGMQYFVFNYHLIRAVRTLGWMMAIPAFILLLKSIFPKEINNKLLGFIIFTSIASFLLYLLRVEYTFKFYRFFTVLSGIYIILIAAMALIRKRENARIFLLSMTFVALSGINDALLHQGLIESVRLTQFGLFLFLLIQSYILASRFSVAFNKNEKMSEELAYVNKNLEKLVVNRTKQIENQNIQLEQLNATKDRFFSIIAHDLRGPVGNLSTSLGLLTYGFDKLNEATKYELLKDLKTSSDKTYHLLENLLIWSRVQQNSIRFEPNNILLNELVAESIDLLEFSAKNKQISITSQIPEKLEIYVDNYMMDMVIRNLLDNAIKFTNKQGKINNSAKAQNDKIEISVLDTGIGIKEENLHKLFKIEHNFYAIGTNGEKGSGLGLILCKEFIEKHNGQIEVESNLAKGSLFKISIPCKIS